MEKIIRDYSEDSDGSLSPIDIKLGADGVSDIEVDTNFSDEMSFDEYSNLFGRKARARRQKRKLERIRNRQERRKLRRAGRREAMRERQEMRTERKQRSEARKKIGEEEEAPSEQAVSETPSEEAYAEEGYAPSEESSYEESYAPDDSYVDEETGTSDEEAGYTGDYGFDGVRTPSQADANYDDFFSAEGGKMIDPKVQALAQRIEKVKTKINDKKLMLNRIQNKLAEPDFQKKRPARYIQLQKLSQSLPQAIAKLQPILVKLESNLANYSKAEGDFSEADGSTLDSIVKNKAEVRQAKLLARKERKIALRGRRRARVMELMNQLRSQGMSGSQALMIARKQVEVELPMPTKAELGAMDNVKPMNTSVDASINQESSSFDSMGLYGLDDNSPLNKMSSADGDFYSADGKTKKKTWMWVGIGVGVAVIGIIAYNMLRNKK